MDYKELRQRVRLSLGNPSKEVVSDIEIDNMLNRGSLKMVHKGALLRTTATQSTVDAQERYSIPSDCLYILRIDYDGSQIPIVDYNDIDDLDVT